MLGAVLCLSLLLRTRHIADVGLSFDESCSAKISTFAWPAMLDAIARDAHPPLYYVVLKAWRAVFGDSQVVLRSLSVVCGLATIVAAYWLMRAAPCDAATGGLLSNRERRLAAILAAILIGASALHVSMSLEARPYTLGTLLAVTSAGMLLRALRSPHSWLALGLFALLAVMLSLTHYYGLFTALGELAFAVTVLAGEGLRTGWNDRTKRLAAGITFSVWVVQLAWVAWLPVFQSQRARANTQLWMSSLNWDEFGRVARETLAGEHAWPSATFGADVLAVGIWAHSLLALVLIGGRTGRLFALCAGVAWLGCILHAFAVRNILGVRYLILSHVFLLLGWALLISRVEGRAVRIACCAVLLAWSGLGCRQFHVSRAMQARFPGVPGAVAHLNRARGTGDPVIVSSPFVHAIVHHYVASSERIHVRYEGDQNRDLLAGPPLRDGDCLSAREIASLNAARIWSIDVGANGAGEWRVPVPSRFRLATERRFADWCPAFGEYRQEIIVREYVRKD